MGHYCSDDDAYKGESRKPTSSRPVTFAARSSLSLSLAKTESDVAVLNLFPWDLMNLMFLDYQSTSPCHHCSTSRKAEACSNSSRHRVVHAWRSEIADLRRRKRMDWTVGRARLALTYYAAG